MPNSHFFAITFLEGPPPMLKLLCSCSAYAITVTALQAIFAVDIPISATAIVLAGVAASRLVEECF